MFKSAGSPKNYMGMYYSRPDYQGMGYIGGKKRHCFRQEQIKLFYAQSNIDKTIETENFDAFSFEYFDNREIAPKIQVTVADYVKQVLDWYREFVDGFRIEGDNLISTENIGVGKAFLTNRIVRELIQAYRSMIYLLVSDLFDAFSKNRFSYESEPEMQDVYQYILDRNLLITDDLGMELNNASMSSQLFYRINERPLRKKGTIISINLSIVMLRGTYPDQASSRIMSQYAIIPLYGDDIRTKKH